jgi:hypothetical protein
MMVKAVGAGPTDRRTYRRADWLDCSERAIANITLSFEVESKCGGRRIIHVSKVNGNAR